MTRVGDIIEQDFHEYATALDSDYTVHFGYQAHYVVVAYKGKMIEQHYTGEGHWRQKRRALKRIVRGHRRFRAAALAEGISTL